MATNAKKRDATSFLDDDTPEPLTKRAKGEASLEAKYRKASLALSRGHLLLLPESQYRLGGTASCPFATLGLGSALLEHGAFEDPTDERSESKRFIAALKHAVGVHKKSGRPLEEHTNPVEIKDAFPSLRQKLWPECEDSSECKVPLFKHMYGELFCPNVLLPQGDIQLGTVDEGVLAKLFQGFAGSGFVLSLLNGGYVFGVHCRPDGQFVVFDSHMRSFSELGPAWGAQSGAFLALLMNAADASSFICNFVLSSRAAILESLAEQREAEMQLQQAEAAQTLQLAAFERASPAPSS